MNGGANPALAIAILAAGSATRFGGGKLDAALAGKPLGLYAVEAAGALGTPRIVASRPLPEFAKEAMALGLAQILVNKRAQEGLGTSVALAALQAAAAGAEALLLLAADMPLVRTETLRTLADTTQRTGAAAALRQADGKPGIPACFPAALFPLLVALEGDRGAGALLRDAPGLTLIEPGPDELRDVDTPQDLAEIAAALSAPR